MIHGRRKRRVVTRRAGKGSREFAAWLRIKGARVEYLHLPDTADPKTGLDDYLAAGHTIEDLYQLVKSEPPGNQGGVGDNQATKLVALAWPSTSWAPARREALRIHRRRAAHRSGAAQRGARPTPEARARLLQEIQDNVHLVSLADYLNVLDAMARQPPTVLHLRVAGDAAAVYVDMANNSDRVIEITDGTWRTVDTSTYTPAYMFRRTKLARTDARTIIRRRPVKALVPHQHR